MTLQLIRMTRGEVRMLVGELREEDDNTKCIDLLSKVKRKMGR